MAQTEQLLCDTLPKSNLDPADGLFFTSSEISILNRLLDGYVVGPAGRPVLEKIKNATKENK